MALWTMVDANNGAPLFAPYGGLGVAENGDVLFDNVQTSAVVTGAQIGVFGVDAREKSNTQHEGPYMTHAGWVGRKLGTGGVVSVAVVSGGKGYVNGAAVVFTGGGTSNTNAAGSVVVRANGSVDGLNITTPGAGYSNGFLTITGGGVGSGANISYAVNGAGNITAVLINTGGSNYSSVPTVKALGANTETAVFLATVNTGVVVSVTIGTPGSYTNTSVTATSANANAQATFSATLGGRAGRREYITLVAAGSMLTDNVANNDDAIVGA